MNVYVVRHGETDWNREGRYQGRRESKLTELGHAQALAVGIALAGRPIERIVSSPLVRCRETAHPLSERIGVAVHTDDRLIEIAHGTWEGRLRDEIARDEPAMMKQWRTHPERVRFAGGESLAEVLARWRAFAESVSGERDLAVVTHDVLVRVALLDATDRPLSRLWEPRVVNGGYARFSVEKGRWHVIEECVDAHLGALRSDPSEQAL